MRTKTKMLKGFTLVELVVVMAIFSMIMFGALALILPVSNQFRSTVKFENVRSNLDNIRLYIEGSLRYADRVHIYTGTEINDVNIDDAVGQFVNDYRFNGKYEVSSEEFDRASVDPSITGVKIYVMTINNADKGKISLGTYDRAGVQIGTTKEYAVNKAFYDNYEYKINFGKPIDQPVSGVPGDPGDGVINDDDRVNEKGDPDINGFFVYENFSPGNFAVTVEVKEKDKHGNFVNTNFNSTATFALMNVWGGGSVKRDLFYSLNVTQTNNTGENKYNFVDGDGKAGPVPSGSGHSELRYKTFHEGTGENIYIVFTLPKQIESP